MKRKYKIGDLVEVFQDTKSRISEVFGLAKVVALPDLKMFEDRYRLEYQEGDWKGTYLRVHSNDFRKASKLHKVLS